jgi:hypothetical protein
MSRKVARLCELGKMPWLSLDGGVASEESRTAATKLFVELGQDVFFDKVNPMKNRSKVRAVRELQGVARKCPRMARAVLANQPKLFRKLATVIRQIRGFKGTGFRAKEILLDLHGCVREHYPALGEEAMAYAVVGPGPRRTLNCLSNR